MCGTCFSGLSLPTLEPADFPVLNSSHIWWELEIHRTLSSHTHGICQVSSSSNNVSPKALPRYIDLINLTVPSCCQRSPKISLLAGRFFSFSNNSNEYTFFISLYKSYPTLPSGLLEVWETERKRICVCVSMCECWHRYHSFHMCCGFPLPLSNTHVSLRAGHMTYLWDRHDTIFQNVLPVKQFFSTPKKHTQFTCYYYLNSCLSFFIHSYTNKVICHKAYVLPFWNVY